MDEMPPLFQKARCLAPPSVVQATQFKNYTVFQFKVKLNLYLLFIFILTGISPFSADQGLIQMNDFLIVGCLVCSTF